VITILIPRLGLSHILNYRLHNGKWRTLCQMDLPKDPTMTTLSADDTFPGICRACKESHDKYYQDNLEYNLQSARNMVQAHYIYIRDYVQDEMM